MRRGLRGSLAAACALLVVALAQGEEAARAGQGPDPDTILDRLDDLYRSDSSIGTVELTVVRPRRTHTLKMRIWTSGTDRALVLIDAPPREKGTATLKVGKNLWNFLPRINRTIRIPPSMMLSSWMGSDLTNDDLVRDSSLRRDFEARLLGRSREAPVWRIELVAKPDLVGLWGKIEYAVSDELLPVEARFFDRRGRAARVMTFHDVKDLGGRRLPSRMVLVPLTPEGSPEKDMRTELRYLDIQFDVEVPEETFSLSRLERNL